MMEENNSLCASPKSDQEKKNFSEDTDLVCEKCVSLFSHRLCKHSPDLKEISKGFAQTVDYKNINQSFQRVKEDLVSLKRSREEDQERVQRERQTVKNKVREVIQSVQAHLENLERTCNQTVDSKTDNFFETITKDITKIEQSIVEIDGSITGMHDNESAAFDVARNSKQLLNNTKQMVREIAQNVGKETIRLILNPVLEKPQGKLELGSLLYEPLKTLKVPRLFFEECQYTAQLQAEYTLNRNSGKTCHILDACLLQDGTLVLTDLENNRLIHTDRSFNKQYPHEVQGLPWGVCTIGRSHLGVTLLGKKSVQIFYFNQGNFVPQRCFPTESLCRGICFHDGSLYVCCGGGSAYWRSAREGPAKVKVFTLEGIHVQSFELDSLGQSIFGRPRDIMYNQETDLLYVTDEKKGVVVLQPNGKVEQNIADKNLVAARGIAFDSRGQIFVGCMKTKCVLLFRKDGTLIGIPIAPPDIQLDSVRSVCFLADKQRLVITRECDKVSVFNLDLK